MRIKSISASSLFTSILVVFVLMWPATGLTHCDTMDGPVVQDAQKALETKNVDIILMWVQEKDETEVKKAFEKTLAVRKTNPEAKELADMYFFETLVRIHRAGEGAPYTGLKAAGSNLEPAVAEADKALESGSVEHLEKHLVDGAAKGVRERFAKALEKKKHAGHSVRAGREYVESYVEFIHYVERLHSDILAKASEHATTEPREGQGQHHHRQQ